MKWFRDESGQVLVMTFFCMGILLGALGLAVDVGVLFHARRNMQAAADAAAMAGATEMFYNGSTNVAAKAYAAAKAMGVDNTVTGNTVNVILSPTLPGGAACPSCVQVNLATPNPTVFIAAMSRFVYYNNNFSSINVSANATLQATGAIQFATAVGAKRAGLRLPPRLEPSRSPMSAQSKRYQRTFDG